MVGLVNIIAASMLAASSEAPAAYVPVAIQSGVVIAQAAPPLEIPQATPVPVNPAPEPETAPPPDLPPAPPGQNLTEPDPEQPGEEGTDDGMSPDDLSLGEIPVIETMELTADIARRALDSYLLAKDKYANSDLEQYENLQDFVDQTSDGKNFEADIKAAGFANVNDWNLAITTLGVTYSGVVDDQSSELEQQIAEVEADTELAQDIKDRMVAALKAMIPSENNKKVIEELLGDPVYAPKLKQLDIEEE
jgi:hypothetical protein